MKAIILAGGRGTRISEETHLKPKPLVEIGGRPILWHILKFLSCYDIYDFIICCGYKGYLIKEYFANYSLHLSDVTIDLQKNSVLVHRKHVEPWRITLIDTGDETATGGRLKRVAEYIRDDEMFLFTYGDGLADIDILRLIGFHKSHGKLATVTAVKPPGKFGALRINKNLVTSFTEKPAGDGSYINGGYFVLSPECLNFIDGDDTPWEGQPLARLVSAEQLMAFEHSGFWHAMDTLREREILESLWSRENPPWKIWR
jgi:glucose-1-phosphate cytidylyltransferase